MKLIKIQRLFKLLIDLKFSIGNLILIAVVSSIGSFIEQDEPKIFYEQNYSIEKPIYGFINSKLILTLGLDHIYTTWWFLSLLIILGFSLIGCTITRQFPLLNTSKDYFFKKQKKSFLTLPFAIKFEKKTYLKELILSKFQKKNLYIYQKDNLIYAYKGLIGRISPILVHFSLILILTGSAFVHLRILKPKNFYQKVKFFIFKTQ